MLNTKYINLCALALVLAGALVSVAHAALPPQPGIYDRDDQFITDDGKVMPGSERAQAN